MDLTRFDFHALRFMESEHVKEMSAEEVGQYVLLLCAAWLGAKDATLPNNTGYLARTARCEYGETVSPLVMERFHIVDTQWGDRLQNDTLFGEWTRAVERSQKKRNAVAVRWDNRRNTPVEQLVIPNPIQAVPSQANPSQTEPETDDMSMKNRINEIAGRKVVDSRNIADLEFLARQYGKEVVIADFEAWMRQDSTADLMYPVSAYVKAANTRLQSGAQSAIIQNDPRITELVAFVYARTQRAARAQDVTPLLTQYELSEIQDAFNAFTEGLDDNELKWAPKNFFQDGAGAGIILARRLKKAADDLAQKTEVASVEAGRAERKADEQKLLDKRREEDEAAARLGDNPF